ncbi:MAG: hypothetical protein MUC38_11355 [Cyclobacteriaceae bacterium]|jgi:hypothetical protein|nr:hypothetical protein [Cyclobacteriaceae bacterium]
MNIRHLFLLPLLWLAACGGSKENPMMKEAAAIHNEAVALAATLEERIHALQADTTAGVSPDSIAAWNAAIKLWESDLVEVPGNEDHHHHDHGEGEHHDHHHHEAPPNVTPEEMLTIQKELKARLEAIAQRIPR